MKVAIIGSRSLNVDISQYIPEGATQIISGGAKGIDKRAAEYAKKHGLELAEFLPNYRRYGKGAPLSITTLSSQAFATPNPPLPRKGKGRFTFHVPSFGGVGVGSRFTFYVPHHSLH